MNPSAARKGSSFAGVVGYITHDVGRGSAERVDFTDVVNMRTSDPEKAAKVMAWTAMHASELKEAAGLKATGRKTTNPVYHFSLNWEPGEAVSHKDMADAAKSSLAALGYEDHEAVFAVHTDKPHQHIHIVVNRIHPETGKTHNPNNDYEVLQRWAYQYEKDRGRVVCLERAIKYEKDSELKAEYLRRRTAEIETGKLRESKPRPGWEAEKDATHPKSARYQDIKAQFAKRVAALSKAGREAAQHRAKEWAELKALHQAQRAHLRAKQMDAARTRRSFTRAAKPTGSLTRSGQQDERAALKKQHMAELNALRQQVREKDAPAVAAFAAKQKQAWAVFHRLARASARGELDATLQAVARTPVGQQGEHHRGHLARVFAMAVTPGEQKALFAQHLNEEKRVFRAELAARHAPAFEQLQARHMQAHQALRERLDGAQKAQKARRQQVAQAHAEERRVQKALLSEQRQERQTLKAKHDAQVQQQRSDWAQLNADRTKAWDGYKAHRASQMAEQARQKGGAAEVAKAQESVKDIFTERSAYANERNMGREGDSGRSGGAGKEISIKGPSAG